MHNYCSTLGARVFNLSSNGFGLDNTIHVLEGYFEEQSDFKEREWLTAVKSGWNYADKISV